MCCIIHFFGVLSSEANCNLNSIWSYLIMCDMCLLISVVAKRGIYNVHDLWVIIVLYFN